MRNTKPAFEKINPEFGSSLVVRQHTTKIDGALPFWHFHPELELVYVNNAKGILAVTYLILTTVSCFY